MALKQNAVELTDKCPLAASVVHESFYIDDTVPGADIIESAISLQRQMQDLLACGGFNLSKWSSDESLVLEAIWPELRELKDVHSLSESEHMKALGLKSNTSTYIFYIKTSEMLPTESAMNRILVFDITNIFDVVGWFSPVIITIMHDTTLASLGRKDKLG